MKPSRQSQNLYLIFSILLALSFGTIIYGLTGSHQLIGRFERSLQENWSWLEISQKYADLEELVQQINAPANNVFESSQFDIERKKAQEAVRRFEERVTALRQNLEKVDSSFKSDLKADLKEIDERTHQMALLEEKVFHSFESKNASLAGEHMARVDQIFADILKTFRQAHHSFFRAQAQSLQVHSNESKIIAREQWQVSFFSLLLGLVGSVYAWGLLRRVHHYRKLIEDERQRTVYAGKMAALGEMAGGIAHEINNPLTIIQARAGQIQNLVERGLLSTEEIREAAQRIEATSQRITKIIRGLISFSRGNDSEQMVSVPVHRLVSETLSLCSEKFKSRGVIVIKDGLQEDIEIFCRPVQIQQVLLNLLNNSYDAISELSEKWIRIEFEIKKDWAELAVEDSGSGIPPQLHEKIMMPFFTTKGVGKGTGLGLSISKGIIESHQGQLRLDFESDHTRFVIALPYRSKTYAKNSPEQIETPRF